MSRSVRHLAVAVAALLVLAACGDDESPSSDEPSATLPAADAPLPDGCAPADGSAAQQREFSDGPPMCLQNGKSYRALVETNHGTFNIVLRPDIAPNTVNSFVNLARYHYFDGTTCHRAIVGFVVQCGDPTGTGGPGYEFDDELARIEPYRIGSIAMANAGPNTQGSQFFIITGDNGAALPPQYTLFGQVDDDDLAVVVALDAVANPQDGPPIQPIDIVKVTIIEA
jgi:cyclophilin family peptidyl-prolyl cis-trans isomerase